MKPEYKLKNKSVNIIHTIYHTVPEDWQVYSLNSFAHEIKERFSGNKEGPILSVTKYKGFVESLKYFKKQIYSKDIKNYKLVEKGDFAYATIHLDEGSLGLLKEFKRGYISPMYIVFRTNSSIDKDFLYYLLKSNMYIQIYKSLGEGSINRRRSILFDDLSKLKIPIPSLNEQQKITLILSNVDDLIQKTDQVIEQTQRLKKGLMQRLLTKGIGHTKFKKEFVAFSLLEREIPITWKISKLNELCRVVRGGSPRPAGDPKYFGGKIPWITVGDLTKDDQMYLDSVEKGLTEEGKIRSRYLEEGTVVLANSGATLGIPKILNISGCINDGVAAFLDFKIELLPEYLYYVLFSWIRNFRDINQGMGQPNLNTEIIGNLRFSLPPIKEQKQIVLYISNLDKLIQMEKTSKNHYDSLKKGLMQKLLTGKLRVNVS